MKKNPENLRSSASQKGFTPLKKSGGEVSGEIKLFRMPFQWNLFRKSSSLTGFTLLEVLIALVILSVGLLGIASLTASIIRTNSFSDDFTTATALAQDKLEELVNTSFGSLSSSSDTVNADAVSGGSKYTRTWTIGAGTATKTIQVDVSWTNDYQNTVTISVYTIKSSQT